MMIAPITSDPDGIGTPSHDSVCVTPGCERQRRGRRLFRGRPQAERSAALDDDGRQTGAERQGLHPHASAGVDEVGEGDRAGAAIVDAHAEIARLGAEDRPQALADQLDDGIEIELPGQRLADLVDEGQLGRTLLRLRQEALGLGEQAGVLEGHAHARRRASTAGARRLSLKAARCVLSRTITPITRSPAMTGTPSHDSVTAPPRSTEPSGQRAPPVSPTRIGVRPRTTCPVSAEADGERRVMEPLRLPRPRRPTSTSRAASSTSAIDRERESNRARRRSPTSSMMPSKSSCRASAVPISLIRASSAARCSRLAEEALRLVERAARSRPPRRRWPPGSRAASGPTRRRRCGGGSPG